MQTTSLQSLRSGFGFSHSQASEAGQSLTGNAAQHQRQAVRPFIASITCAIAETVAQQVVDRVIVLDVANEIAVVVPGGKTRIDTEIAQAVRNALEWDVMVNDERIRSTVATGWVTLEGTVTSLYEREDVERAVRHLAGVRGVTDQIVVTGPSINSDVVQKMIEDALERRAARAAHRIKISVSDGIVNLTGRIRSWAEKRAILGAVSHAPGIQAVNDDLFVDPLI